MKKDWMAELASHYQIMREMHPQDRLMILFDIDGTILDMRYMVLNVLKAYDLSENTDYFKKLQASDIKVHENQIKELLEELQIPQEKQAEILTWYNDYRWSSEFILHSHQPFSGVLEVIRWFQLQPNTTIALNTGRPESLRSDTLRCLNKLGEEFKVFFSDELVHMNPHGWGEEVENTKIEGILHFQDTGYRIIGFVDNEPDNLKAVSQIDSQKEILLLHANTIFESKRSSLSLNMVKGKEYDLTELIPEKALPQHIQFVWHGINDEGNLRQFLSSDISWGECDVRLDPTGKNLILRQDSFVKTPFALEEEWYEFDSFLNCLQQTGKSIKIDLKAGGILIDKVQLFIDAHHFNESRLWFNSNVERLQEQGFRKLADAYPNAILQCPVDFLAPLICSAPEKAREILDMFVSWGINRFSINWQTRTMRTFFDQMDRWRFGVNIYNVPDLESFLKAVLLMPQSITSDFNFPKWYYYGRGAGEEEDHSEYATRYRQKFNGRNGRRNSRNVSER